LARSSFLSLQQGDLEVVRDEQCGFCAPGSESIKSPGTQANREILGYGKKEIEGDEAADQKRDRV